MRGPRNQTAGIALATVETKDAFDGNLDLVSAYTTIPTQGLNGSKSARHTPSPIFS